MERGSPISIKTACAAAGGAGAGDTDFDTFFTLLGRWDMTASHHAPIATMKVLGCSGPSLNG